MVIFIFVFVAREQKQKSFSLKTLALRVEGAFTQREVCTGRKSPVVALKVSCGRKMDCVPLKSCKIKDVMGLAGRAVLKTMKSG